MTECTVYSPCGRYVVRLSSSTHPQQLRLDVTPNAQQPRAPHGAPPAPQPPTTTPSILWSQGRKPASPLPQHLVATLAEADVIALTSSAGVRKTFHHFLAMLYDALIGRSACVHFYVETVAEMKERIQRDVQGRQRPISPSPPSASTAQTLSSSSSAPPHTSAGSRSGAAIALPVTLAAVHSSSSSGRGESEGRSRMRATVGDTVIELDADIADDVLEQRFLTVDYDVDFTRAIFPIPLTEPTAETEGSPMRVDTQLAAAPSPAPVPPPVVPAPAVAVTASAPPVSEDGADALQEKLHRALARLAAVEDANTTLRRENAALVQLSKQKMHEMQRLCNDFQHRVHGAAEAEQLRATNAALRVRLQEVMEERQAAQHALERERSRQCLRSSSGGRGGRSSSRRQDNPYLRSLSRDSDAATAERGRSARLYSASHPRSLSRGSGRVDRNGRPILSPTPTPTSKRRPLTRFDTPPAARAAAKAGPSPLRGSSNSTAGRRSSARGGGGDSPAPRDRTGGRLVDPGKPRRTSRGSTGGGGGSAEGRPSRSRASSSSSSVPRRGPSLWADASDQPSPRGSVASSSRCSSASHERLYRASTASSRLHQTPKAYALEQLGARRAVFH